MTGNGKMASLLSLAAYMTFSSALIILNKHLMVDDGFGFPLFLTGAGQIMSVLLGLLAAKLGMMPLRQAPSASFYLTKLLPLVFCSAGSLFFGNVCYLYLSVSFIQIMKAVNPGFTLAICTLTGLETSSPLVALSIVMISVGTAVATLVESSSLAFSWLGFSCILLSTLLEAGRVVYIQLLLGGSLNFNAVEITVWLGPPTAAILFAGSYLWEYDGLMRLGFALIRVKPLWYTLALLLGFAVNMSTALAIQATSSLTFKVVGCIKNAVVIWFGVLLGDHVQGLQMLGNTVAMAGFLLYSRMKLARGKADPKKAN